MRRFPLFHMATMQDVIPTIGDYSYNKGKEPMNITKAYGAATKRALAIQVFHSFMKEMLDDMMENNVAVEMPLHSAAFLIEKMPEQVFDNLRTKGKLGYYSTLFNKGDIFVPVYRFKKRTVYI
jgi:hypothetical protein